MLLCSTDHAAAAVGFKLVRAQDSLLPSVSASMRLVSRGASSDICMLLRVCEHQQESMEELAPLSSEQQQIADRVVAGHSVFFTGCAGQRFSPFAKATFDAP